MAARHAPLRQDYRDAEGAPIEPPKGRTFAAIRRSVITDAKANTSRPTQIGQDGYKKRAWQYVMAMRGIETSHSTAINSWNNKRFSVARFVWDTAPDRKRIRFVFVDGAEFEIPHWNFVATCVDLTDVEADVFA